MVWCVCVGVSAQSSTSGGVSGRDVRTVREEQRQLKVAKITVKCVFIKYQEMHSAFSKLVAGLSEAWQIDLNAYYFRVEQLILSEERLVDL